MEGPSARCVSSWPRSPPAWCCCSSASHGTSADRRQHIADEAGGRAAWRRATTTGGDAIKSTYIPSITVGLQMEDIHPTAWLDSFPPGAPANATSNTKFPMHLKEMRRYYRTTSPLHRALRIGPPNAKFEESLGRRNHQVLILEERYIVHISGRLVSRYRISIQTHLDLVRGKPAGELQPHCVGRLPHTRGSRPPGGEV